MFTTSQCISPIGKPVATGFPSVFHVLKDHMDWKPGSCPTPKTEDCGLVQNGCGLVQLPVFGRFLDRTFKHYLSNIVLCAK